MKSGQSHLPSDLRMRRIDFCDCHNRDCCQAGLQYRNPGDDLRLWQREQGAVSLRIEAGAARHLKTRQLIELGLP